MHKFGDSPGALSDIYSVIKLNFELVGGEPQGMGTSCAGLKHMAVLGENLDATLAHVKVLSEVRITKKPFMSGLLRCTFISASEGAGWRCWNKRRNP